MAAGKFISTLESLSGELFLSKIDDWTSRDIAAHLVWWNRNMLSVCQDLQNRKAPSYYADTLNDYRNINAMAIKEFAEKDRQKLLGQLKATLSDFTIYLTALDAKDWDAESGVVHPRGGAATIARVVESLTSDYETHTRQIIDWMK